jgi:membrane protein
MARIKFLRLGKGFLSLLREAFKEFQLNDPLRMAAATTFFATFALPPILIILVEVFGFFGNSRIIRHNLLNQLGNEIDKNTVLQLSDTLKNVRHLSLSWYAKTGGFIFLLFVATTLFIVINSSLNQLWKFRRRKNNSGIFMLWYRAKSIGIILIAGILFLIVLTGNPNGSILPEYYRAWYKGMNLFLQRFLYYGLSWLSVISLFVLILKYLADGRPSWKVAIAGGVFTGILFSSGKIFLNFLLSYDQVQTIYGASTALVLLFLFIFYSSFMFYFGACFTKVLAIHINQPILPTVHAFRYKLKIVEWDEEDSIKN